jgi:hypothetical protein
MERSPSEAARRLADQGFSNMIRNAEVHILFTRALHWSLPEPYESNPHILHIRIVLPYTGFC